MEKEASAAATATTRMTAGCLSSTSSECRGQIVEGLEAPVCEEHHKPQQVTFALYRAGCKCHPGLSTCPTRKITHFFKATDRKQVQQYNCTRVDYWLSKPTPCIESCSRWWCVRRHRVLEHRVYKCSLHPLHHLVVASNPNFYRFVHTFARGYCISVCSFGCLSVSAHDVLT